MSIFQENINISTNLCQYFKKCKYLDKFMPIFQKMSTFQQIYVNLSNTCQYFMKFMSNPSMEGRFATMGVGRYP